MEAVDILEMPLADRGDDSDMHDECSVTTECDAVATCTLNEIGIIFRFFVSLLATMIICLDTVPATVLFSDPLSSVVGSKLLK